MENHLRYYKYVQRRPIYALSEQDESISISSAKKGRGNHRKTSLEK